MFKSVAATFSTIYTSSSLPDSISEINTCSPRKKTGGKSYTQHIYPLEFTLAFLVTAQFFTLTNVMPSSSGMSTDGSVQSNKRTRCPRFLRPSARCLPMYPAPPVIKCVSRWRLWSPLPLRVTTIVNVCQETAIL